MPNIPSPKPQYRESKRFLNLLWSQGLPVGCWITVAWKVSARDWQQRHYKTLNEAAIAVTREAYKYDTYISCGVPSFEPELNRRAIADEVSYVSGFWLDIDFGTDGHASGSYPSTIEQAYQLLAAAPKPTLVVESGHGLQVWWLFDEPYELANDAFRQRFVSTFLSLHSRVSQAAQQKGWKIDSTHDLARLLRPAGTSNRKASDDVRPVILATDDGPRWSFEDIEKEINSEELPKTIELSSPTVRKEKVESESSDIPWADINSSVVGRPLLAGEFLDYDSASERDVALAKVAVNNGATRDQVQSLIRIRRIAARENPAKAEREDYIERTYKFALRNGDGVPTQPDVALVEWFRCVLPNIVLSEKHSVGKVLTYMVQNARGARFIGTRRDIELGLACDSKTVTTAWKSLKRLGFTRPINENPYEGIAKGWVFLLPTPSKQLGE